MHSADDDADTTVPNTTAVPSSTTAAASTAALDAALVEISALRAENDRLQRLVAVALEPLRTPTVPRELFERVLAVADGLAAALAQRRPSASGLGASGPSASTDTLDPTANTSTVAATLHALDSVRAAAGVRPTHLHEALGDNYYDVYSVAAHSMGGVMGSPHRNYGPSTARGDSPSVMSAVSGASATRGRLRYHHSTAATSATPDRHSGGYHPYGHPPLPSARSPSFANANTHGGGVAPSVPPARYPLLANGQLDRIVTALGAGRHEWAICNSGTTATYTVSATFPAPDVEALGVTSVTAEGGRFVLSVPPGETRPFVRGIMHGARISVANGPASASSRSDSAAV